MSCTSLPKAENPALKPICSTALLSDKRLVSLFRNDELDVSQAYYLWLLSNIRWLQHLEGEYVQTPGIWRDECSVEISTIWEDGKRPLPTPDPAEVGSLIQCLAVLTEKNVPLPR